MSLRIELSTPAVIHWSTNSWATTIKSPTVDTGIGMQIVDLGTSALTPGSEIVFTMESQDGWEGQDYHIRRR